MLKDLLSGTFVRKTDGKENGTCYVSFRKYRPSPVTNLLRL